MRGPLDLSRELIEAEVLHEFVHLRRRIDDVIELPDVLDVPAAAVCTVHLYDTGGDLLAALVPAGSVPATTALARAARAGTVHATDAARVSALTDFNPALVAPVGLPPGTRTVVDAGLREQEVLYTATGDGSTALKIRTEDLLALTGARVDRLVEPGIATGAPLELSRRDHPAAAPW